MQREKIKDTFAFSIHPQSSCEKYLKHSFLVKTKCLKSKGLAKYVDLLMLNHKKRISSIPQNCCEGF